MWQALQEHDGKNWETEEELLPSGHQAPKLKLSLITSTWLHLINSKIFTVLHHLHCCYMYTLYNLLANSSCTSLFILLLFIKSTVYCIAHFILLHILFFFIFYLYLYIFSCVVLHILHCPLIRPDLIYISLLIIFCTIEYVTNKTLNLIENRILWWGRLKTGQKFAYCF